MVQQQPDIVYLNTASCGLLSKQSLKKSYHFYDEMQVNASGCSEQWRMNDWQSIRQTLAQFMDAPAENVAFVPNFTSGLLGIVHSLKGNEKILLFKNDFPSVLEPFRINNFDITLFESVDGFNISIETIKKSLLEHQIEVFVISHVQFNTGFKIDIYDLAAFCRQQGIVFIVDATQSLGALELSMRKLDADVVIASNYKWMNAGLESGVMYIADSFLKRYTPKVGGYNSYTIEADKMYYQPSARSFEPGHLNAAGLLLLDAAMKEKLAIGLKEIERHNITLTSQLLDGIAGIPLKLLGDATMGNRNSIVIIKDENGLGSYLAQNNIIVTIRGGLLRISMHFYNTSAEVDQIIKALKSFYEVA